MSRREILARFGLIDAEAGAVESCKFAGRGDDKRYILIFYAPDNFCPQVLDLETARELVADPEMRGDPLTWKITVEIEAIDSGLFNQLVPPSSSTPH